MAGHSKWARIKRKKAATDAKRGKHFTRLLREVQVAARLGGANVDGNPRLKTAISVAKANSVPNDNIDRAISRGAGDGDGIEYEEIVYEGYGPGGVALLIKAMTDNRNRTVAEVRHALSKCNGNLGSTNSVAYLFNERGVITIPKDAVSEEQLFDVALDAGADDISDEETHWEISTEPEKFEDVRSSIEKLGCEYDGQVQPVPETTVSVAGKDAEQIMRLMELLDDLDDVQDVVANFEIDDAELESLSGD